MGNIFNVEKIKEHIRNLDYKEPMYVIGVFQDSKSYCYCLKMIYGKELNSMIVLIKDTFDSEEFSKLEKEVLSLSEIFKAPILKEDI